MPLHLGGVAVDGQLRYALEIPEGLSLLAHWDPNAEIVGLNTVPPADQPNVNIVHPAFQLMVAAGFGLVGLGGWFALAWRRRRDLPRSRWFNPHAGSGCDLTQLALRGAARSAARTRAVRPAEPAA